MTSTLRRCRATRCVALYALQERDKRCHVDGVDTDVISRADVSSQAR